MMPKPTPMSDTSFAICGVCGDEHDCGFGWAPNDADRILWTCTECLPIAPHVYGVVPVKHSIYADLARDYAGMRGGAFLDSIGKTDLVALEPDEWTRFLDVVLRERAHEMRRLYAGHVPRVTASGDTIEGSEPVREVGP